MFLLPGARRRRWLHPQQREERRRQWCRSRLARRRWTEDPQAGRAGGPRHVQRKLRRGPPRRRGERRSARAGVPRTGQGGVAGGGYHAALQRRPGRHVRRRRAVRRAVWMVQLLRRHRPVFIFMGICFVIHGWRSFGRQIRREEGDGRCCCTLVLGHNSHSLGCLPLHHHVACCTCTLWPCRRCCVSDNEHFPTKVYNINLKQAAWFSAIPWAVMAMSGYVAGASADFLIKSGFSIGLVRKIMQSIGFMGPCVSLLCLRFAQTPSVAAVLMTIALSLCSFSQAGYMCNIQDIAPKYAGSLHGLTNGIGTVAAIVSTIGIGYFVQWLGSFQAFLTLTAALYFSATIFYNVYATGDLIFD
uniref:Anion transporter 3, chloroplastic n=1 Tax=Zea mays TaxID=4577 RepID=C0HIE2_MAIZE|nr:unknown [Zea mays]